MKRLALFLDGTWNDPDSNTNVARLHAWVAPRDGAGIEQRAHYLKGVGTEWHNRLRGGALGSGLSGNVLAAYAWLVANHEEGDQIHLFGFSRGAYTARSVAGVIVRCGLLRPGATLTAQAVYERYRAGKDVATIYQLEHVQRTNSRALTPDEAQLLRDCRRVPIRMIGVWDTVGALGIPWTNAPLIGRRQFHFHNTNPSVLFEHACQALAIDEHRGPYKPALWTQFIPDGRAEAAPLPGTIEQRWFAGAHSNVGGGYEGDRLCDLPLAWLQARAQQCGLAFTQRLVPDHHAIASPPVDSYARFMGGAYKWLRLGRRYQRPIGAGARSVRGGRSLPLNECIDASVIRKLQAEAGYRPWNLLDFAQRRGLDLLRADPTRDIDAG